MTLSFSKKNISDLSFREKIIAGLHFRLKLGNELNLFLPDSREERNNFLDKVLSMENLPKIHTIRRGNRWRPGMKIHLVQNNRTPQRFQFAPTIECVSVQDFEVVTENGYFVLIDGEVQTQAEIEKLAVNDGFNSAHEFCQYFNNDFIGQIIHWTDFKYQPFEP